MHSLDGTANIASPVGDVDAALPVAEDSGTAHARENLHGIFLPKYETSSDNTFIGIARQLVVLDISHISLTSIKIQNNFCDASSSSYLISSCIRYGDSWN